MSQVHTWIETRERAVGLFHDAPSAPLEQRVIDVFREHPALVVEAVAHVGARFEAGKIRAPWVILAKHVEQAVTPLENVSASDERDRTKAIGRCEQWMRAVGKHFDSEGEIVEELFGDLGRLRHWRKDERLHERMLKLWREVRSEGERIEDEADERAQRWMASRLPRAKEPEPVLPSGELDDDDDDIPF